MNFADDDCATGFGQMQADDIDQVMAGMPI
jgi:hypothetical protein